VQSAQNVTESEKLAYTNQLIEKKLTRHYTETTCQLAEVDQSHVYVSFELET